MTWYLILLVTLFLQAPAPPSRVVVGLIDGRQLALDNPEFTGFIQGFGAATILRYQQAKVHGEMPTAVISRIDFRQYEKGQPFALTLTLKNGQKLEVQTEYRDFVTVTGNTAAGMVFIKHPDPISHEIRLTTKAADRKRDLTIQYLEFPASSE